MGEQRVLPRILVAETKFFHPETVQLLERHADVQLEETSEARLPDAFHDYHAVWIRLGFRIDAATLANASQCRALACPATGLDHIDLDACRARGIEVVSLKGEVEFLRDVRATAELTIALALALLRKIPAAFSSVLKGDWDRDLFRGRELCGSTFGIVGMGRLGSLVAKMLRGFDARVIAFDPRPDFPSELAERVGDLGELLERSDVVSLHVPYDSTTRHLIGAPGFSRMRRGTVLLNTSRGGVVDEASLLDALETGQLGGAALDVIEGEPHPELARNPLILYARSHENLLLVPHIGGNTWESTRKADLFVAKKLLKALGIEARA